MLTNYFHAILTVVLHQFNGLGFADGMEGVVRLAEASPYIRVSCPTLTTVMFCLTSPDIALQCYRFVSYKIC